MSNAPDSPERLRRRIASLQERLRRIETHSSHAPSGPIERVDASHTNLGLPDSRQGFRSHIDQSSLCAIQWDESERIRRWSSKAETIFGWRDREVLGKKWDEMEWVYEDDVQIADAARTDLLSGKADTAKCSIRNRCKDGRVIDCNWFFSVSRDEDGNVISLMVMIEDVTEQARAEAELQLSEQRYRAIVEDQTEFIVRWHPDGTLLFANDCYCRHFGVRPEDAIETDHFSEQARPNQDSVRNRVTKISMDSPVLTTLHPSRGSDDKAAWTEWTDHGIFDDHGDLLEIQSVGRDVTQRIKAEEDAERARRALRLVMEGTARATGTEFFDSLVSHLAEALGIAYVLLARVDQATTSRAITLAFWENGVPGENFEYQLAGTPCENVLAETECYFRDDVQRHFPADEMLAAIGAESYRGVPLISSSGRWLGLLSAIDVAPMDDRPEIRSIMNIFANRAAVELERLAVVEALAESEERYRLVFDQQFQCMAILSPEGRVLEINDLSLRVQGTTRDLYVGKYFWECPAWENLPDWQASIKSRIEQVPTHQGPMYFHDTYETGDGKRCSSDAAYSAIRDADGNVRFILAQATDTTDRDDAIAKLRASEDRFRKVVKFAPEAVVLLDTQQGRFAMANPAAEELFQQSEEELCCKNPADVSPPMQPDGRSSAEKAREVIALACDGKMPVFEWVHCDTEGREIPCEVHLLSLEIDGRTFVRGSIVDISQRIESEAHAKEAAIASAKIMMLSPREQEVFQYVVRGLPNKSIARRLEITIKTVEKHRSSLMKKLQSRTVADLVRLGTLADRKRR